MARIRGLLPQVNERKIMLTKLAFALRIPALALAMGAALCVSFPSEGSNGIRGNAESFYPNSFGVVEYQKSLTPDATFSKMFTMQNGFAGYSMVWINGLPWLIPVYFPFNEQVHQLYPWLVYPPK